MEMFKSLKSHLGKLHDIYFTFTRHEQQFLIVFRLYFGEEHKTLSLQMFQYLSQLQWKLARHNLHECDPKTCLEVLRTTVQGIFNSKWVTYSDHDSQLWQQRFKYYMGCDPEIYRRQLLHVLDGLGNIDEGAFERAFLEIFGKEFSTVKRIFSQNMDKRQEQLTKEKLHENDSKNALTALMTPFQRFFHSEWPIYTTLKTRDDFQKYTGKYTQIFKDTMIHDIDDTEKYLIEAILHEHEIEKRLKL
ncbi:hypothetical protein Tco_1167896 [Tanacetum coccineum]